MERRPLPEGRRQLTRSTDLCLEKGKDNSPGAKDNSPGVKDNSPGGKDNLPGGNDNLPDGNDNWWK